jgi:hypothetical protein
MGRGRQRADRIREAVPLDGILADYGYDVVPSADREQQFSCDLHGDGADNKPSARFYPDSSSWYCFACSRSRDAITTVMEKEGVSFGQACSILEKRAGLPPLPWDASDEDAQSEDEVVIPSDPEPGMEVAIPAVLNLIDAVVRDREVTLDRVLRFYEAYDRIVFLHGSGSLEEPVALAALARIHTAASRREGG